VSAGDYDNDGLDDDEDDDDDDDGVLDFQDGCPQGDKTWTSDNSNDYDGDGCNDNRSEESDDDNDGVGNAWDDCSKGKLGWSSTLSTDWDSDGCHDTDEDTDDDDDGFEDFIDSCPKGIVGGFFSKDWDEDGCHNDEDSDDDNDGVFDVSDDCSSSSSRDNWYSDGSSDHDGDGCKDEGITSSNDEDTDDDNDGKKDTSDDCPRGKVNWVSNDNNDLDYDGCHDTDEDNYVDCTYSNYRVNPICSNYDPEDGDYYSSGGVDEELVIGMWIGICFLVGVILVMFFRGRKRMASMSEEGRDGVIPQPSEFAAPTSHAISSAYSTATPETGQSAQGGNSLSTFNAPFSNQQQKMTCALCLLEISSGGQKQCDYCGTPYHHPCSTSPSQCVICNGRF